MVLYLMMGRLRIQETVAAGTLHRDFGAIPEMLDNQGRQRGLIM
jgi:hypothetical protein